MTRFTLTLCLLWPTAAHAQDLPDMPSKPLFAEREDGVLVFNFAADRATSYSYTSAVGAGSAQTTEVVLQLSDGDWFCVRGVNAVGESPAQRCNTYRADTGGGNGGTVDGGDPDDDPTTGGPFQDARAFDPAGAEMTLLNRREFSTKSTSDSDRSHGWDGVEHRYGWTIFDDATAPVSPSKVARWVYSAGMTGGRSPGGLAQIWWRNGRLPNGDPVTAGSRELYLRFPLRLGEGFQSHRTGTNKLMHLWGKDFGNRIFFGAMGPNVNQYGSGFEFGVRSQGSDDPVTRRGGNVGDARLTPGEWYTIEVYLRLNDPGVSNGVAKVWINGEQTHDYADMLTVEAGEPAGEFGQIQISPTWGGGGDTVRETFDLRYDDIEIWIK